MDNISTYLFRARVMRGRGRNAILTRSITMNERLCGKPAKTTVTVAAAVTKSPWPGQKLGEPIIYRREGARAKNVTGRPNDGDWRRAFECTDTYIYYTCTYMHTYVCVHGRRVDGDACVVVAEPSQTTPCRPPERYSIKMLWWWGWGGHQKRAIGARGGSTYVMCTVTFVLYVIDRWRHLTV